MLSRRHFIAAACIAAAAAAAADSACSVTLDAPLSLQSLLTAPPGAGAGAGAAPPPPLFLRHAGFVAWLTPSSDALDALDSTFVARAALSGDAGAASFENADEFPGYYLAVDAAHNQTIRLLQAPEPRSASFFLRAGAGGLGCALEPVAIAGALVTAQAPASPPPDPAPCHYAACPPVAAVAAAAPSNASTWLPAPPNNIPAPSDPLTPFVAGGLFLEVRNVSGTIATLRDAASANFSFTPSEAGGARAAAGSHRLGDVTLRARRYGAGGAWAQATTTVARPGGPVAPVVAPQVPAGAPLWAADLTPLLNASSPDFAAAAPGLSVARELAAAPDGLGVIMSIILSNAAGAEAAVEVGGLDVSIVTNNDWTGLSLEQNAGRCSLADPFMGLDGGFVRVARITGEGPVLLVTPSALSCNGSLPGLVDCGGRLEGWRPLRDDPAPRGVAFEGFYSWAFLTRAWAEAEWAAAQPWNEPTSLVLRAGESAVFSLRLSTVPAGLDAVDAALAAAGLPFARASPGTVLPADMTAAHLLVRPPSPAGGATFALDGVAVDPPFAIAVGSPAPVNSSGGGLLSLPLAPAAGATGRARITLRFSSPALPAAPPLLLTAHFLLLPPLPRQAQRLGAFASGPAWLNAAAAGSDPFGRVFAFGHWDAAAGAVTLQESRAWVAGLSDESGAAMALAAASLTAARPDDDGAALALAQLATYANRTLRGTKRNGAGEQTSLQQADGGVRASMFFSGMPNFNYSVAPCWDEPRSLTMWRAYNYPHQVMVQLYLYRVVRDAPCTLARAAGIVAASGGALDAPPPWQESLRGAAATHAAMWTHSGPGEPFFLSQYGLMVGGGHADLLDALAEEATAAGPGGGEWASLLATANAVQVARAEIWGNLSFPYGSEMPWDSTGQEELYTFAMRLGDDTLAQRTLAAVKAYTPDVPHWGYSGSARRYFDFLVYGSPRLSSGDTEREFHHYGSGLNSAVLLGAYRRFPNESLALRAGFAASWGAFAAVDVESGAPSMAFHADPALLRWDYYSGDAGQNIFGALRMAGCYLDNRTEEGRLVGFGCDVVAAAGSRFLVSPLDAARRLLYIGPLGASVALRGSGSIAGAVVDFAARTLTLAPAAPRADCGAAPPPLLRVALAIEAHPDLARASSLAVTDPPVPPLVRGAFEFAWQGRVPPILLPHPFRRGSGLTRKSRDPRVALSQLPPQQA